MSGMRANALFPLSGSSSIQCPQSSLKGEHEQTLDKNDSVVSEDALPEGVPDGGVPTTAAGQ